MITHYTNPSELRGSYGHSSNAGIEVLYGMGNRIMLLKKLSQTQKLTDKK